MILFITSITLSAFLLFQVQPLIGKLILPWFGGTSAVWSAVLLFFQTLLTGGYAYAYWLLGRIPKRWQAKIHLLLLGATTLVLIALGFFRHSPITPSSGLVTSNLDSPIGEIFKVLFLSVGLPYFVLATNSTIIQAWFQRRNPDRSPYWLYAVSNAGSLLALITYPLLVEPLLPLASQGWVWTFGFLLFAVATGWIARRANQNKHSSTGPPSENNPSDRTATPRLIRLLWIFLSATASILLLATTSQLTQEIAPIPFLWVLPLTVYLLSFVITFSGENRLRRPICTGLLALCSIGLVVINGLPEVHFLTQIAVYTLFLFAACLVAHGELYTLRPAANSLPQFYLLVSIGGALGGIAVNFAAPMLFNGYWEFHLGWVLLIVLLLVVLFIRKTEGLRKPLRLGHDLLVGALAIFVCLYCYETIKEQSSGTMFQERNFYGVSTVYHDTTNETYRFIHGSTVHGLQYIDEDWRGIPTSYFWEGSGIARIIGSHPARGKGMRVGVLGLGIGTLAAHGQPGDVYRFYEINPDVIDLASGLDGYFSFLNDSPAEITIIAGDARIQLERELARGERQQFDLLVMDAFSSDSVPVHLLTREAFDLYLEHLSPMGVIAVNITNRYLDLEPVVWLVAKEYSLHIARFSISAPEDNPAAFYSEWILLTSDPTILAGPDIAGSADLMEDFSTEIRLWTDSYSNLFQILD